MANDHMNRGIELLRAEEFGGWSWLSLLACWLELAGRVPYLPSQLCPTQPTLPLYARLSPIPSTCVCFSPRARDWNIEIKNNKIIAIVEKKEN